MLNWSHSVAQAEGPPNDRVKLSVRRVAALANGARARRLRAAMDHNTVFGAFRVDRDGVQIGHKIVTFQWQAAKKVIVWPEELAAVKARFPTPPWSQRP